MQSSSEIRKKKICFAFDRDGTVETSSGPVPISLIKELKKEHFVFAYGNSKLCEEAEIEYAKGSDKTERLKWLKSAIKADRYIVVDDVQIDAEGWEYKSPKEFLEWLKY